SRLNQLEECCLETQSMIRNLNFDCTLTCDLSEVLTAIVDCCEQTQSNFRVTWNILGDIYTTITNLDFDCTLTCDMTEVLTKLEDLLDCCQDNCSKLACIKELLTDGCDVAHTISAPTTITEAGTYCVINNITQATEGSAITIAASGVTLNLNGFTVSDGTAIAVSNVSDVIIYNGIVSGAAAGISIAPAAANIQIRDVTFQACRGEGLSATNVVGLTVDDCMFYNGRKAIQFVSVNSAAIRNTQIVKNAHDGLTQPIVDISASTNVSIENSVIAYNTMTGDASAVYVHGDSTGFNLINTEVTDNYSTGSCAGVKIEASRNSLCQNSSFNNNISFAGEAYGLWLSGEFAARVENCNAAANAALAETDGAGFFLEGGANCTLIGSTATNHILTPANKGIKIVGASNCYVSENTLLDNAIGIDVAASSVGMLKNYADNTTNYVGFAAPIVTFTKATGVFAPAVFSAYDNVSAV
ncbi:MAG: right-handed parallel beta-helix repeat-containing protein, partial [Candidatus Berkiella sp.]